ncbi:MAG TPA: alkaline phosphatase family protein [Acidimicrobiia bacterium]|jgi:phospholipase C|nr:alkaline phosphatase family protein [Acidimicrobiia bacterium]
MTLTRRELLTKASALAGGAALVTLPEWSRPAAASTLRMPRPESSGIDHIVVVMMENRSFDHYLGWLPGADGTQAGLSFTDATGVSHSTYHLTDFQGGAHPDPDHSWLGGRVQYDNGACDGWLHGANDEFAIGYYTAQDLAFYGRAAPAWTVCDRYFCSIMAETYPNRLYLHAAQTDRLHNNKGPTVSTLPTVWDRLQAAGRDGRYYFSDAPFTALWGPKYASISEPVDAFFAACASGRLPDVAYVDPRFLEEGTGTSGDDHPHADIRVGQHFLSSLYKAVTTGPAWSRTMFIITYDEWGGFFDHVPPPVAPDADPKARLRGFRVPCIVVSPRARRGHVAHNVYDHTSILKLIEWRFGLAPLTKRDAAARNLAEVLDFSRAPNLTAPQWNVPPAVGLPVVSGNPADYEGWKNLLDQAIANGFGVLV